MYTNRLPPESCASPGVKEKVKIPVITPSSQLPPCKKHG